jgi:hypothetical protein
VFRSRIEGVEDYESRHTSMSNLGTVGCFQLSVVRFWVPAVIYKAAKELEQDVSTQTYGNKKSFKNKAPWLRLIPRVSIAESADVQVLLRLEADLVIP